MNTPLVSPDELSTLLADAWDDAQPGRRLFLQAVGNASRHADAFWRFYTSIRFNNQLGDRLTELIRLKIAHATGCPICLGAELEEAAVADGMTEAEAMSLADLESATFEPEAAAALRFAERFAGDHTQISTTDFQELHEYYDAEAVMELALLCATFYGFGRVAETLEFENAECTVPASAPAAARGS